MLYWTSLRLQQIFQVIEKIGYRDRHVNVTPKTTTTKKRGCYIQGLKILCYLLCKQEIFGPTVFYESF